MNYRRIASVVGFVVLLAFVIPFFVYAVPGVVGADHSFVVLSGSMEPEISPGDVVIVQETDATAVESGDVVTYVRDEEGTPVTHRVIGIEERNGHVAFETKGDANPEPDSGLVPGENLIGTVTLTIPYIGYIIQFTNTPEGFALLVGLPIGLLVLSEVWRFVRSIREDSSSPEAELSADGAPVETDVGSTEADDEVAVHVADLTTTLAVLVLMAPYSVYVAFQLRTTVAITAAFVVGFSTFALGGLWLAARFGGNQGGEPTTVESAAETTDGTDRQSRSESAPTTETPAPTAEPSAPTTEPADPVDEHEVTVAPEPDTRDSLEEAPPEPIAGAVENVDVTGIDGGPEKRDGGEGK